MMLDREKTRQALSFFDGESEIEGTGGAEMDQVFEVARAFVEGRLIDRQTDTVVDLPQGWCLVHRSAGISERSCEKVAFAGWALDPCRIGEAALVAALGEKQ